MSREQEPQPKFMLSIAGGANLDPDKISLKRLRDAVAGKDATIPRSQAMALLLASDFPNKHRDVQSVLQNEKEEVGVRLLAAANLGRINTQAAMEVLIKNSHIRDGRILAVIMTALGRIGDKLALDVILKVKENATGLAASRAAFAATLLSHRLGLTETEWPPPESRDYLELPADAAFPFQITRAGYSDVEYCLRSLAARPFGVEFDESNAYAVRRWRRVSMLLFNRDFAGEDAAGRMTKQKAFLGVIAGKNQETGQYAVTKLILTTPSNQRGRINILLCRPYGELVLSGTARVDGKCAEFLIRSISLPGARPTLIHGAFGEGKLEIMKSLTSLFVPRKLQATAGLGPEMVDA